MKNFKTQQLMLAMTLVCLSLVQFSYAEAEALDTATDQAHTIDQHKNSTHDAHAMSLHLDHHDMLVDDHAKPSSHSAHQHDAGHQCQYCTVYANLVLPPEFGIQEVFERVQVRLLFLQRQFAPIYFYLQRLFLMPQGRAPTLFA